MDLLRNVERTKGNSLWNPRCWARAAIKAPFFPSTRCSRVQQAHFERWPTLFAAAVNENFAGQKSEEAKRRALCIADTFARLIGMLTDQAILSKTAFRETTGTNGI